MNQSFLILATIGVTIGFVGCKNYEFITERAELLRVNSDLVKNVKFHFGKFNRTTSGLNFTLDFIQDFSNLKMSIKCYQFYHNEYRFTGTQVKLDICKIQRAKIFSLQEQFRNAGLFIDMCNVTKGTYKLVNFAPEAKYYPSYLLVGKLRCDVRLHDDQGSDLFRLNFYFEIREI